MKPVLVIMAAGMGSRYGGLKQIDPIDDQGHMIMDYSMYDAKLAGFEKVIIIIKKENEADFKEVIGDKLSQFMEVVYVYQEIENLPDGFSLPSGREKPWGTGHAILSCINEVHGPLAVINADDYYGQDAFKVIYDYLATHEDGEKYQYTMVGYALCNTVTDSGYVARGVCSINGKDELVEINERTRIERKGQKIAYTLDEGENWVDLEEDTIVSMNMWGFTHSVLNELKARFPLFLEKNLESNSLKCEYFLPSVIGELIEEDKVIVKVLTSKDKWYGVTYKEDKPEVMKAIQKMQDEGKYPKHLWK